MNSPAPGCDPPQQEGLFPHTPWPVLSCPARSAERVARAQEELYRLYRRPLFAIIVARGYDREAAHDLTQGFMLHLFRSRALAAADPAKGRFRDFLRGALAHYLSDLRDREHALCRGGGALHLSLDEPGSVDPSALRAESALPGSNVAADRAWAQQLLDRAQTRLEERYTAQGRADLFHSLKAALTLEPGARLRYDRLSATLGRPVASLRCEAGRLHLLFRHFLRQELRRQVGSARLAEEWEILREILRHQ